MSCATFSVTSLGATGLPGAEQCGSLENAVGPADYRTAHGTPFLKLVEGAHFNANVETLKAGQSSYIGGDLDYTLRAFPNHHRALVSMLNLRMKEGTERPRGLVRWPVACYFERAIRFRPDDGKVRVITGIYLMKLKQKSAAIEHLEAAVGLMPEDADTQYNLGLAYLDLGETDKAVKHAVKAYELGFPLPGLRNRLIAAGKWPNAPRDTKPPASADLPAAATQ